MASKQRVYFDQAVNNLVQSAGGKPIEPQRIKQHNPTPDEVQKMMLRKDPKKAREQIKRAERIEPLRRAKMSPPGAFAKVLNPLLDRRRVQLGVVDRCLSIAPVFDRILVYQAMPIYVAAQKYGESSLYMPEQTEDRELQEAPRGLLLSAGVRALEYLRSHGVAPGHFVYVGDPSPMGHTVDYIGEGVYADIMLLNAGDLTGSEDLQRAKLEGFVEDYWDGQDYRLVCGPNARMGEPGEPWDPLDLPDEEEMIDGATKNNE